MTTQFSIYATANPIKSVESRAQKEEEIREREKKMSNKNNKIEIIIASMAQRQQSNGSELVNNGEGKKNSHRTS